MKSSKTVSTYEEIQILVHLWKKNYLNKDITPELISRIPLLKNYELEKVKRAYTKVVKVMTAHTSKKEVLYLPEQEFYDMVIDAFKSECPKCTHGLEVKNNSPQLAMKVVTRMGTKKKAVAAIDNQANEPDNIITMNPGVNLNQDDLFNQNTDQTGQEPSEKDNVIDMERSPEFDNSTLETVIKLGKELDGEVEITILKVTFKNQLSA